MEGFIQLHRKLIEWEWYEDINTFKLFIHFLLKANYKDKNWRGMLIKRGSFVTSLDKLSKETGLSVQNVRTSIKRLKLTNEVTSETTSINTVITVVCYDKYQNPNKQVTNDQQTTNKRLTTTNKDNNNNKENNINTNTLKSKIDFSKLVSYFNKVTGKRTRVVPDKARKQIKARIKEGYTKEDIAKAILNASKDKHHIDNNYKYLTLEFISRPDKFTRFVDMEENNNATKKKLEQL